jgi:GNAT superfamily N-acetyltransferase
MTPLSDFGELSALLSRYARAPVANNYMMPAEARGLIGRGALSYSASESALLLFERRGGGFKMFFHVFPPGGAPIDADVPLAAYLVGRGAPDAGAVSWLEASGFREAVSRIRVASARLNIAPSLDGITPASQEEAGALFGSCFDALTSDLPSAGEYGELLAVRDGRGEAMGILHAGDPILIAVRPEYRRRGAASRLYGALSALRGQGRGSGSAVKVWVAAENKAALGLYRKLGFTADGMSSVCYIKE